jgi:hypothetical protein
MGPAEQNPEMLTKTAVSAAHPQRDNAPILIDI